MPRSRTLTGRVERQRNRSRETNRRDVNVNDVPNRNNQIDILSDSFKIALNLVPKNFVSYSLGPMNFICRCCNAKHFESEITSGDRDVFSSCCHKGKVFLAPLSQNAFFNELYENLTSSDPQLSRKSRNFFDNIRNFNASFAMVSSEANVDDRVLRGIYHFKIHNVFYHRIGPLTQTYGRDPSYAQLYFFDVDTANNFRANQAANQSCDRILMREIAVELNRINPFVQSFLTLKEHTERVENRIHELSMVITVNRDTDIRRFNNATATDVAVIFRSTDGEPPFERNMISFSRTGVVRQVSVLDSSLDPLAYPILFPNGDFGWHQNMIHNVPRRNLRNVQQRDKVTMLQFASYRLALRDNEFSFLHHAKKLFLQWIVDMYVRIEGGRLHFIRENQASLRSDLYRNLTDHFVAIQNNQNIANVPLGRRVILPTSFTGSPRNMHQNYLDAMSIVAQFGKPSLFITMTCNPNWPEIVELCGLHEPSNFRPEIVVRVFNAKLKELIDVIVKKTNIWKSCGYFLYNRIPKTWVATCPYINYFE